MFAIMDCVMFTDSHSHIQFADKFPDIGEIIKRAQAAGVTRQVIVGCTPQDSLIAVEFANKHKSSGFWATIGVHPHDANLLTDGVLLDFRDLAGKERKIVAIGEIGLDYYRNFQPREMQIKAFRLQLRLAKELGLAAVIHVRDAWDEAIEIMGEEGNDKLVLHCFSGNFAQAELCWKKGYYLAFNGTLTYPKNHGLREIAAAVPEDLILIETDCPYLTPQPYRGKRNEPAYVVDTAKELADVRGVKLEEIAKLTTDNAIRIFGLA